MAKRIVKWSVDGTVLKMSKQTEKDAAVVIDVEFDLAKLFPEIQAFNDVQKQLVIFATKQKLMDTGASEIGDYPGKLASAKEKWAELCAGKWTGERTNSTGAAENKRIVGEVKDLMKVVSLEGLLIKKALRPAEFTEEDGVKLAEFMARAVGGSGTKNEKKK